MGDPRPPCQVTTTGRGRAPGGSSLPPTPLRAPAGPSPSSQPLASRPHWQEVPGMCPSPTAHSLTSVGRQAGWLQPPTWKQLEKHGPQTWHPEGQRLDARGRLLTSERQRVARGRLPGSECQAPTGDVPCHGHLAAAHGHAARDGGIVTTATGWSWLLWPARQQSPQRLHWPPHSQERPRAPGEATGNWQPEGRGPLF